MDDDIYNINNYSEHELFEILDINNPTDRELEMCIQRNIAIHEPNKYKSNNSSKLYRFFKDMYLHFFDIDASSDEEYENDGIEGFATNAQIINKNTGQQNLMSTPDMELVNSANAIKPNKSAVNTGLKGTIDVKQVDATVQEAITHNVEYVKDKLNPIKRETMFKMISIDSQFREDPRNTSATNFSMNLSSSIENVVAIKLYSIQIPYTWYMINEGFGTNFFYIKGNSPGINNGNHDIKIDIGSGNYTVTEIINTINNRITQVSSQTEYIDVSLGNTKIQYNANTAKTRFEIDVKKTYTEADYQLYFPSWSTPNIEGDAKSDTIPSFLGFNYDKYYPFIVYGKRDLINFNIINGNIVDISSNYNSSIYELNENNNYIRVVQYIGPENYNEGTSTIIQQFDISFSYTDFGLNYNRTQLLTNFQSRLLACPYIDISYSGLTRVDISNSDAEWNNHTHFELKIKLNRKTTQNIQNASLAVILPNDSTYSLPIWIGANSCFGFTNTINQLDTIVSETPSLVSNYIVDLSADKIEFNCIRPGFDLIENKFTAIVPTSLQNFPNGYLLNDYKFAINEALSSMNDETVLLPNYPNGMFNINNNTQSTFFNILNDTATFQFDITRIFDQTAYIVDLTNCFLSKTPFNFPTIIDNLTSSNYELIRTVSQSVSYNIPANDRIILLPKTSGGPYGNGYGNQTQQPITIILTQTGENLSIDALKTFINTIFQDVIDPITGNFIMIKANITSTISGENNIVKLTLRIDNILTESDYRVNFTSISQQNNWNKININSEYILSNYMVENAHALITGTNSIFSNTIQIKNTNNTIILRPFYDGVYDSNNLNDIIITVPVKNVNYTRAELLIAINTILDANPLTVGSNLSILSIGNSDYGVFKIHINKTYLPKDFKLVFYDAISFSYCSTGTTGGRSVRTATWDSTLGWLLGFHSYNEFILNDFTLITNASLPFENYYDNVYNSLAGTDGFINSYNSTNNKICVQGDSVMNTNIYNYFMIILDDFIQNHVNDGLVTITSLENDISLPTYASRVTYQCDPITGQKIAVSASNKERINLTSKQLYAMNQIIEARQTKNKSYSAGPVLKDIFAIIPLKLSGMAFGQTYMEFGGTLQNQDRKYFGPVRIQKLSVKLMNDKGDVVNLNGANWSFTIICEIMVKNT